jgi:N-acetylglucosamine kinase-like BadF-type ATPase
MKYFAGIDGGQSSTVAVIGDETGRVLARGKAGPADEVAQGAESTRLRDALRGALADAVRSAGLPTATHFAAIVAGVSGYDGKVHGRAPDLPSDALTIVHDTAIAHAGALGGNPGIIVIAGTGSVAFAKNASGETALAGGWGYLFGDEGSAFWLARDAISDAMRDADGGEQSELQSIILEHFARPTLRALVRAFYAGEISRSELAAFAPAILRLAAEGNERASQHVRDAAAALVLNAKYAADRTRMRAPDVAFIGGLMQNALLNEHVNHWMRELLPDARRVDPQRDAAEGALLLAYRCE